MNTQIYYEPDADLSHLENRVIAIIGYVAQGAAHARNARDSGCQVLVGQRPCGPGFRAAVDDGFDPLTIAEAAERADLINLLLPDEVDA